MLTFISRTVGVAVVMGLAIIGLDVVVNRIFGWKDAHDRERANRVPKHI